MLDQDTICNAISPVKQDPSLNEPKKSNVQLQISKLKDTTMDIVKYRMTGRKHELYKRYPTQPILPLVTTYRTKQLSNRVAPL